MIFERLPHEASADSAFVELVQNVSAEVRGERAEIVGVMGWTDAAVLAGAGIESILFGCKGEGAHAIEEWVARSRWQRRPCNGAQCLLYRC